VQFPNQSQQFIMSDVFGTARRHEGHSEVLARFGQQDPPDTQENRFTNRLRFSNQSQQYRPMPRTAQRASCQLQKKKINSQIECIF
jgi:hypothetical protein